MHREEQKIDNILAEIRETGKVRQGIESAFYAGLIAERAAPGEAQINYTDIAEERHRRAVEELHCEGFQEPSPSR